MTTNTERAAITLTEIKNEVSNLKKGIRRDMRNAGLSPVWFDEPILETTQYGIRLRIPYHAASETNHFGATCLIA